MSLSPFRPNNKTHLSPFPLFVLLWKKNYHKQNNNSVVPGEFMLWVSACQKTNIMRRAEWRWERVRECESYLERPAGRACWGPARRLWSGFSGVEVEGWEALLLSSSHLQKKCLSRTWTESIMRLMSNAGVQNICNPFLCRHAVIFTSVWFSSSSEGPGPEAALWGRLR